jgi:Uma2 family endonuclease
MSEVIELDDDVLDKTEIDDIFDEEEIGKGSLYHSSTQTNLANLLFNDDRFVVLIELSLDTGQIDLSQFGLKTKTEMIPDLCIYKRQPEPKPKQPTLPKRLNTDILRVSKMPTLAIEVLAPSQSVNELLMKFDGYFALGIQSCWLVMPALEEVKVYSQQSSYKTFDTQRDTEVTDEVLDINLPIKKIFEKFEW